MESDQPIDVIIPTCRTLAEVQPQIDDIYRTAGCPVSVFATCQPISAAKNRNIGLDWSASDPVIMLDDDIRQTPMGWVARMVRVMAERPKCVMLSPRLMKPDGSYAFMMGCRDRGDTGLVVCAERRICTACIAIRRNAVRFDETFRGSGFEDNDYAAQLIKAYPDGEFIVDLALRVVHLNEMKSQHGDNWRFNKAYMLRKWGHD